LSEYQQERIPALLRKLLHLSEFKTKASRMGKVVRVSLANIKYYQLGGQKLHLLAWPKD
jgi:hypothetical protein